MHLDPEDQTDGEQTVRYDRRGRRRLQPKRVEKKVLDVIRQRLAFPEDFPSTVEEDVTHTRVVRNSEGEILPVHGFGVTKDPIDDTESGLQVRVFVVMFGTHDRVPVGNGPEHCIVRFVPDALALDGEVEEGLSTEVRFVLEPGDDHGTSGRTIETFEHRVVETFQRSGPDAGVPDDLGDEPHDSHDDVRVHRHLEHPGDAVRVQHVAGPINLLVEERGWLVWYTGNGKPGVIAEVAPIKCTEPAQTMKTRLWLRSVPPPEELTSEPPPDSLEVLLCSSSKRIKE